MNEWIRSSFCEATACAEVSFRDHADIVWVRSTNRGQGAVFLTRDEWDALVAGIKAGEFDHPWLDGGY